MPNVSKSEPRRPVKFPPPTAINQHRVKTGDNWGNLAQRYGRPDPWDIIEFNFQTRNPREVNWYLEYYVGCTQPSADGKNYSLDSMDSPGYLFIPPRTWTPNLELAMRQLVLSALSGGVVGRVSARYGGYTVNGSWLAQVANRVIDGDIRVLYDPYVGAGTAEYDAGTDCFHLGFRSPTLTRKALIVHEAVHAALDMQRADSILRAESEALAYAVQCYYVREHLAKPGTERLYSDNPLEDRVFELGWMLAEIMGKGKQPSSVEWLALEHAVRNHPKYKATAGYKAGFDGI